jgi:hypothetical protein
VSAPNWLKATARTIRNSDRLTSATDRVFGAVQGNRVLVDVATRVFAWDAAVPVVFLDAGKPLAGLAEPERLPIIVIDAIGAGDHLDDVLAEVSDLQAETRGFRPVLLLDQPAFGAARAYGYPVELVIPEDEWDFTGEWADYVARRRAMMLARYRAWTIVAVLDGRLDPTGRRLLAQLADYRPWEARKI